MNGFLIMTGSESINNLNRNNYIYPFVNATENILKSKF